MVRLSCQLMRKMKDSTKEMCAHCASRVVEGAVVIAAMPVMFAIGIAGLTVLTAVKTVDAANSAIKKIKNHTLGK